MSNSICLVSSWWIFYLIKLKLFPEARECRYIGYFCALKCMSFNSQHGFCLILAQMPWPLFTQNISENRSYLMKSTANKIGKKVWPKSQWSFYYRVTKTMNDTIKVNENIFQHAMKVWRATKSWAVLIRFKQRVLRQFGVEHQTFGFVLQADVIIHKTKAEPIEADARAWAGQKINIFSGLRCKWKSTPASVWIYRENAVNEFCCVEKCVEFFLLDVDAVVHLFIIRVISRCFFTFAQECKSIHSYLELAY